MEDEIRDPYENVENPNDYATATLLSQINPAPILVQLENKLRGARYDNKNEEWVAQDDKRFMNELGISKVMPLIGSVVNTNTILSNLGEKEIARRVLKLGNDLIDLLTLKYREYQIDPALLQTIVNMCVNLVDATLKRGMDEGERNFLKKNIQSTEHTLIQQRSTPEKTRTIGNWFK